MYVTQAKHACYSWPTHIRGKHQDGYSGLIAKDFYIRTGLMVHCLVWCGSRMVFPESFQFHADLTRRIRVSGRAQCAGGRVTSLITPHAP